MQWVGCIRCFCLFSILSLASVLAMVDNCVCVWMLFLPKVTHLENVLCSFIFCLSLFQCSGNLINVVYVIMDKN